MELNKSAIIQASIDILSSYGLADMTMRRVATHLAVAPGALYWHIKNKQALIDATARTLLTDFLALDHHDLREAALFLRTTMLGITDGAELVGTALISNDLRAEVEGIFSKATTADTPQIAAATLVHYVVGASVFEQNQAQRLGASFDADNARDQFLAGVDIILNGIQALSG
ncbi:TetR family transcriptional regulator [Corynebacterium sp. ES2794-CONJ1]|uniref:TetR family transcriptional regulator n=1 Tax=unclassified Corynebacterium TaxID=2624378 RepID=UPI002168292F|nr:MULTISPECIES: TetR family transcriptional regulator [unclassified Corynebacterium]MCS4489044.1 TetR family transcriptional regulator [Corynebacterium sp. ES2775-CONJ]MCU9518629.1 TetR family transcriptional regulator [Corynebacterium sp. ES2794-CONJ1]